MTRPHDQHRGQGASREGRHFTGSVGLETAWQPCPEVTPALSATVTVSVQVNGVDALEALARLERWDVITTDPARLECCGMPRAADGRCYHKPGKHAVYVGLL